MVWLFSFWLLLSSNFGFAIPDKAQPTLPQKILKIGGQTLKVEIADTPERQEAGLMFRKSLKEGEGMLFIFPNEQPRAFWMKNTFIDLAIGYFDGKKTLIDIQEMKAAGSLMDDRPPNYPSSGPAKYALEVPKEWFKKHHVKVGMKMKLEGTGL